MSEPEHVTLAREAQEAGLIVTHLMPAPYGSGYHTELWQPDGTLWIAHLHESAPMIRAHVAHYPAHRQALESGPRPVDPAHGQVLTCGCTTTTDTTEEPS